MPRLSIIIPVRGNLERLEDTLVSVLENRPDDSEIVVVLDQAYDDPYNLEDEIRFVQASSRAGLADSVNLGIEASQGPILHLLACGALVHEGWTDPVLPHFADPWVAAVAPLVLESQCPQRIVSAGLTYLRGGRQRLLGQGRLAASIAEDRSTVLGPHATAAFYRKAALEMVGRFSPVAGEELAGLDVALRLAYAGFRTVREPACAVCADRPRSRRRGAFRRAFCAERLFWRWAPCFGWSTSLPLHAATVAEELLRAVPRLTFLSELAGRMAGQCFFASGAGQRRELRRLRESARAAAAAPLEPPHFGAAAPHGDGTPASGAEAQSHRSRARKATV